MSDLKICRICLNKNVKLYKLETGNLKHYYEQITRSKVASKDDLPHWFCYECAAHLHKYHKFREKCDQGQNALRKLKTSTGMGYSVVEDMRKRRVELHSSMDIINDMATKRVKTYTIKHKVEMPPLEMENIIVNAFPDEDDALKYELQGNEDASDECVERIKEECQDYAENVDRSDVVITPTPDLAPVIEPVFAAANPVFAPTNPVFPPTNPVFPPTNPVFPPTNPVFPATDPVFPPSNPVFPPSNPVFPPSNPVYPQTTVFAPSPIFPANNPVFPSNPVFPANPVFPSSNPVFPANPDYNDKDSKEDDEPLQNLLFDDKDFSDDGSNYSTEDEVVKEPEPKKHKVIRRSRRNAPAPNKQTLKSEMKEPKKDESEPERRRFEIKEPKHKLSKDNWEIQVLKDDEALERFKQKAFDSKYLRSDFKCEKCYKGFSKHDMLMRHNTMWHEKPYQHSCRFCHMQFKWKNKVTRHMMEHYYIYKCLRCNLQCNREHGAQFHEDYHNGKIHKCKHCGEEYTHISTYYTHLRTSHRNSHVCKLCGASFVSDAGLNSHMRRKHCNEPIDVFEESGTANNIYCQKCDISFVSQSAYNEHLTQTKQHEEENNKFKRGRRKRREILANSAKCHHCDKEFKSKTECKEHVATEHPNKNKAERVICEVCGAVLSSAYIDIHMNRHTRKKVYPCQTCGKEFLCATSHNTHQLTHSGEKPFPCPACPKRFGLKGHMDIHYKRIHLKEPYPKSGPTLCPVCSKPFPSKANMDVHYKRVHLKEPYPKSGPKPCPVCAKNFPSRAHMTEHYRRVHLKEPYPKRTYNRKKNRPEPDEVPLSNLFQHKMMHHLNNQQ